MKKIFYNLIFLLCFLNITGVSEALISKSTLQNLFNESQVNEQKIISKPVLLAAKTKTKNVNTNRAEKIRKISSLFIKVNPALKKSDSEKYASNVMEASEKFGQDPYVIASIIVHESTVNNKAISKGGDYGLMQVRWKVHESEIKKRFPDVKNAKSMFDSRINILYGTEIFAQCMSKTNNTEKALLKYSSGSKKLTSKVLRTLKDLNK